MGLSRGSREECEENDLNLLEMAITCSGYLRWMAIYSTILLYDAFYVDARDFLSTQRHFLSPSTAHTAREPPSHATLDSINKFLLSIAMHQRHNQPSGARLFVNGRIAFVELHICECSATIEDVEH